MDLQFIFVIENQLNCYIHCFRSTKYIVHPNICTLYNIMKTDYILDLVPDSANVECDKGEEEEGRGVRLVTDAAVVDNRLKIKTGITSESEVILDINEAIEREEDSLR